MAGDTTTVDSPPTPGSFSTFLKQTGIPSGAEVEKKETELFEKHKAAREPLLKQSDELMKKMVELNDQMAKIKTPEAPKLKDLPDAPSGGYEKNPMMALASIGTVLAVIGSLRTRAPLTSALNAAAASMNAYHEGDMERVALEHQKWKENLEKGMRQNQLEMDRYTQALEQSKFDITKAQGAFRVIAAENEHLSMHAAIEDGDYKAQMEIINAGVNAGMKAAQIFSTEQYRLATIAEKRKKDEGKVTSAKLAGERAVKLIDQMQDLLQNSTGITGAAGMVRRPMESVKSFFGGDEGKSHQYESLARELQQLLRQTNEFYYKGRTLSREVADRDVLVRGMKLGDTDSLSYDQLQHLRNVLTGEGSGYEEPSERLSGTSGGKGGTDLPKVNGKGWKLMTDKDGNKAYVSPDKKQFEAVPSE